MKKIAYFIDSDDPGGAETLIIDICRKIKAYNYEPVVLHFGNIWLERKCDEYDLTSMLVPGHKYYKSIITLPIFCLIFSRFIKNNNFDLLHSHLFDSVIASSFTAFISRLPHIGTLHDIYTIGNSRIRAYMLSAVCFLGTELITVSNQMRHHINRLAKFPKNSIEVIENGVDIDLYKIQGFNDIRKELNIDPNEVVIICVARLVEIKAHNVLIEAANLLNKRHQRFKLLLVGEGPERIQCISLINKAQLTDKVILLGQRDNIPELLKMSDCFVLSSKSEGLSCSIIEAMAAGLPAVVTDVGGNRELIEDGKNGYVVSINDSTELAIKLEVLINDRNMRKKYGEFSIKKALEKFSLNNTISNYVKHYEKMLNK